MSEALRSHWPEYLMEAACLGIFMISASTFGVLLDHPDSALYQLVGDPLLRRLLTGVAMGVTAICLIYSPWGKQSGGHMNPAVTLTFFRLGQVKRWDAAFYVAAQFVGGAVGVVLAHLVLGALLQHPSVNYVATLPGKWGELPAFAGEFVIAFILMFTILRVSNSPRVARFTGLFAGVLIALYITLEAPLSGMSMNPARTFASAVSAMRWDALWIYFTAPALSMLAAAEVYVRMKGRENLACAKLHHQNEKRCIHCGAKMLAS
jgi:aquaporin Z